eukprot:TRINITY_DN4377_c0_g1_i3.p1 TRINITY_DN4377_c0_g1~~TRINITY_DN4377_c0_g1_i3.p1  ORF type:complete len:1262 (-),score=185.28 TRINITY_DN4377_c0_g1_i3:1965-5750(-)
MVLKRDRQSKKGSKRLCLYICEKVNTKYYVVLCLLKFYCEYAVQYHNVSIVLTQHVGHIYAHLCLITECKGWLCYGIFVLLLQYVMEINFVIQCNVYYGEQGYGFGGGLDSFSGQQGGGGGGGYHGNYNVSRGSGGYRPQYQGQNQWQPRGGHQFHAAQEDINAAFGMMGRGGRGGYQGMQQQGGQYYQGGGNTQMMHTYGHNQHRGGMTPNGTQPVVDMKSLQYALDNVEAGTGQIRQILNASTFRPRLPGLTKIMSRFTKDNKWQKAQEVFDALQDLRIRPDTTIANAAISACDKGGQWEKALQIFKNMEVWGLERDAITYSAVISALAKGRQWTVAIEVFHHMCSAGIEADAVTCCSLITALDKGGQWQLAEQVFLHMYAGDPRFHLLLSLEDDGNSQMHSLISQLTDSSQNIQRLVGEQASLASQQDSLTAVDAATAAELRSKTPNPLHMESIAENESQHLPLAGKSKSPAPDASSGSMAAVAAQLFGDSNNAPEGTSKTTNSIQSKLSGGQFVSGQESFDLSKLRSVLSHETHMHQFSPLLGQHSLPVGVDTGALLEKARMVGGDFGSKGGSRLMPTSSLSVGENFANPMSRLQRMASDAAAYEMLRSSGGLIRKDSVSTKKAAPNRVCCNALLAAYSRAKPAQWKRALKLLDLMWECGNEVIPDIVSYNTVMKACSNAGQLETALQVYHVMKQRGLEPSVATYGTLITAASEVQAYDTVMMIWDALNRSGLDYNTTCVNALIHALEQQDRWEEAWAHFRSMLDSNSKVPANTLTFNTMMQACVRRGEAQRVKQLMDTMFQMNIQPTIQSYNILLKAYTLTGQWKEALEILKYISRADVNVRPSVVSYNCVLEAILKASQEGSVQERDVMAVAAIQVVEQCRTMSGCEPDVNTFNNLIAIMNQTGKYPQALQAYEQMVTKGVKPDSKTASSILVACAEDESLWEISIALFNKLKSLGIEPDSVVYNVSVTACARGGAWQQALQIFSEMMTGDFAVDPVTLQTIMKGLRDAEQWELFTQVFEILKVNKAAFNTNVYNMVLSAYEICGDYDKGTEVLRELLEAGLAPDHATLNSLLSLLNKSKNNWSKSMEAFEWMLEGCGDFKLYPTQETYVIMMEGLVTHKQINQAIDVAVKGHTSDTLKFYTHPKDDVNQIATINLNKVTAQVAIVLLTAWIQSIRTLKKESNKTLSTDQVHIYCPGAIKDAITAALEGKADTLLQAEEPVERLIKDKKVEYEVDGNEECIFSIDTKNFYAWIEN